MVQTDLQNTILVAIIRRISQQKNMNTSQNNRSPHFLCLRQHQM